MVILRLKTIAPVIIITGIIISSLMAAISISASSYTVNATRDLPDSVSPGSYFNVTLNFTAPADEFNSVGAKEVANETAGMSIYLEKEDVTPTPDLMRLENNTAEIIWYGPYDLGTEFRIDYSVYVPEGVEAGNYTFNGGVEYYIKGEGYKVYILGDNIIDP